jgi:hypothetical protein
MAMKGHKPGGGIASKQHVRKPVRTGAAREHIQKAAVAQIGQRQGDHVTNRAGSTGYRGESLIGPKSPISVSLGNEVALNVRGGGPGTGRTIYKTGTQCMTGAPDKGNPTPKAKELWPGWEK